MLTLMTGEIAEGLSGFTEARGPDLETGDPQEGLTAKDGSRGHSRGRGWPARATTAMTMTFVPTRLPCSLKIQTPESAVGWLNPPRVPASCWPKMERRIVVAFPSTVGPPSLMGTLADGLF